MSLGKQKEPKELTSTGIDYTSNTLKAAVEAVKGSAKLSPAYLLNTDKLTNIF